MNLTLDK